MSIGNSEQYLALQREDGRDDREDQRERWDRAYVAISHAKQLGLTPEDIGTLCAETGIDQRYFLGQRELDL